MELRSWNLCRSQLSCVSVCSDGFQLASIRHFVMEEHTDTKKAPTVPVCSDTSADGVSPIRPLYAQEFTSRHCDNGVVPTRGASLVSKFKPGIKNGFL